MVGKCGRPKKKCEGDWVMDAWKTWTFVLRTECKTCPVRMGKFAGKKRNRR